MIIPIGNAVPGMTIVQDVPHPHQGTLVPSQTVLTAHLIETLKNFHVQSIHVSDAAQPAAAAPTAVPPEIIITVSSDAMNVNIRIEPRGGANESLTADDLLTALASHKVVFGINEDLIAEAVNNFKREKKPCLISHIARGQPPLPGHEGGLSFNIKHLTDAKELEKVQKATYCWELLGERLPIQRAAPGTVIAHKIEVKPPTPGTDVFGRTKETEEIVRVKISCDTNVEARRDETEFVATAEGVAYFINGQVGVLPLNFNSSAEIKVSDDLMQAELILHPAVDGGQPPTHDEIWKLLTAENVLWGLKTELIETTLKQAAAGVYPDAPLIVAEGKPPVPGENGRVEYLFNVQTSLKPRENPDGSVDFKNVDLIQTVSAGQPLARLIAPTYGVAGKNIRGQEKSAKHGLPVPLPVGPNTAVSPQDSSLLISQVDGNVHFNGKVAEVSEGYVIKGSIDLGTGNVNYEKSVTVGGDVKSGFTVNCGGDLQVSGIIEDVAIRIGGSILCKHGFIGQGKGVIEAKGDVNLGFIDHQTVRSHGSISIAHEALNSNLYARKEIHLAGNPISATGGTICARDAITARSIGNMSGSKTVLEIGTDFFLAEELVKAEKSMAEIEENLGKLQQTASKYVHLLQIKKQLPPSDARMYAKIQQMMEKLHAEREQLDKRKNIITANMHNLERAYIAISHAAMTGTFIKFGQRQHIIREELVGPKTIRLIDFEIRIL